MRRTCKGTCSRAAVLLAVVLIVIIGRSVAGQSVAAPGLKAAYLFNFAQFVEWPENAVPARSPLTLCVVNDGEVADALDQTIKGRTVGGHDLNVKRLTTGAPLPTCHVLYLGGSDLKRSLEVIGTLKGRLVLTVGDAPRFAQNGGMVELFIEDGRMRFAVNVDALESARVRLSSRVLTLAKIVRGAGAP